MNLRTCTGEVVRRIGVASLAVAMLLVPTEPAHASGGLVDGPRPTPLAPRSTIEPAPDSRGSQRDVVDQADADGDPEVPATDAAQFDLARHGAPTQTIIMSALVGAAGGVLVGLWGGRGSRRHRSKRRGRGTDQSCAAAPTDPLIHEMVGGLIASYDLTTNDGQRARLEEVLRLAGVLPVVPTEHEVFDPRSHHALGVEPTDRSSLVGRVARTERPGWVRGDEMLRLPEVVVHRPSSEASP